MKRVQSIWMVVLLLAVVATGCGASQSYDEAMAPVEDMEMAAEESRGAMPAAPEPGAINANAAMADVVDRMIIYTGELSLVVKDTDVAQAEAISLAEEAGGYVSNASSYAYDGGLRRINLTLRVPAEAFSDTMAALRDLALEVTQDSIGSEDVTQEYVDLESRLKALEVKAERLEELMDEAEDTEAVLAIYEELSETQIQIEETKGRMQYLERRSGMATITVYLTPDELSQPIEIVGWRPQGTVKRAVEALVETVQFLVEALIWIVLLVVPVLAFTALVLFVFIRILKAIFGRGRAKKRAAAESAEGSDATTQG
ncbi:MAG: DUF4349 domain-containing protein [Anaerolineae bacterium]|nr:DUF4349 domain-containing protein [Anaerolineae bacterium]